MIKLNDNFKKRIFQKLKSVSNDEFWREMDILHTIAYELAVQHYTEAGQITLTPKQQKALHDKAEYIRSVWDNIGEIEP